MKTWALGIALAAASGTALASEPGDLRTPDAGAYAARVYYRMDFGSHRRPLQSVGLRFDSERATASGAPSLFGASFGEHGLQRLTVGGFDFRGAMLSASEDDDDGGGFFASMTPGQWFALGFTFLVFTQVAVDSSDDSDASADGTGGT